jgi:formate hydrogenlyase subunit 4
MRDHQTPLPRRVKNLGLAAIAGQAGCVTLLIVFVALFLGLWLDAQFEQSGLCTFGMLVLSVPFSLYAMLRLALSAINRIQIAAQSENQQTDDPAETKEV